MSKKKHAETPEPEKKLKHKVVAEFWDGPHLKKVGDTVFKTKTEAFYLVPHVLELDEPDAKPASQSSPTKETQSSSSKLKR